MLPSHRRLQSNYYSCIMRHSLLDHFVDPVLTWLTSHERGLIGASADDNKEPGQIGSRDRGANRDGERSAKLKIKRFTTTEFRSTGTFFNLVSLVLFLFHALTGINLACPGSNVREYGLLRIASGCKVAAGERPTASTVSMSERVSFQSRTGPEKSLARIAFRLLRTGPRIVCSICPDGWQEVKRSAASERLSF